MVYGDPPNSSEAASLEGTQTTSLPLTDQTVLVLSCTSHSHSEQGVTVLSEPNSRCAGGSDPAPPGSSPVPGSSERLVRMQEMNRRLLNGILCVPHQLLVHEVPLHPRISFHPSNPLAGKDSSSHFMD